MLSKLYKSRNDLLVNTYYYFQHCANKEREKFKEYKNFTHIESLKTLKHDTTHWLSFERCVQENPTSIVCTQQLL